MSYLPPAASFLLHSSDISAASTIRVLLSRSMNGLIRWSSTALSPMAATGLLAASAAHGVPIDLTESTPSITGATSLHIDGISTLGSSYWADFEWNGENNKFEVVSYGVEGGLEPPEGFALIDPGTYTMGSPVDELRRLPRETQHEVTLTKSFYLAKTEVTQSQWTEIMGTRPGITPPCDDCPVESVNWYGAVNYCNTLSALEDLDPAYEVNGKNVSWTETANGYRLPTEAEWEYACRAGTTTAFYNGEFTAESCSGDPNLDEIGWYCGNGDGNPQVVGTKAPNAWGLHDMSGNVWEWCWDWYAHYSPEPVTDPTGPESGMWRIWRGGDYSSTAQLCRSAFRYSAMPDYDLFVGFRIARTAP